jgi:hypothetical protein
MDRVLQDKPTPVLCLSDCGRLALVAASEVYTLEVSDTRTGTLHLGAC